MELGRRREVHNGGGGNNAHAGTAKKIKGGSKWEGEAPRGVQNNRCLIALYPRER